MAYFAADVDCDRLRDVITGTVYPTSWDDVGGPGSLGFLSFGIGRVMLVSQTDEVQAEIAALSAVLRKIAADTAAGRPALRYGWDFPDGSPRDAGRKVLVEKGHARFRQAAARRGDADSQKSYGLDARLDSKVPDAQHAPPACPLLFTSRTFRWGSALDEMLRPFGLGWTLQEGMVVIMTLKEGDHLLTPPFILSPTWRLPGCRRPAMGRL